MPMVPPRERLKAALGTRKQELGAGYVSGTAQEKRLAAGTLNFWDIISNPEFLTGMFDFMQQQHAAEQQAAAHLLAMHPGVVRPWPPPQIMPIQQVAPPGGLLNF